MTTPILATKLYFPPSRPELVLRPRLVQQLNEGVMEKIEAVLNNKPEPLDFQ